MKNKDIYRSYCRCGKLIKGFSQHHLIKNIEIHELTSQEHKLRIKEINDNVIGIIDMNKMNPNQIRNIMANHSIMINDIISIGG